MSEIRKEAKMSEIRKEISKMSKRVKERKKSVKESKVSENNGSAFTIYKMEVTFSKSVLAGSCSFFVSK